MRHVNIDRRAARILCYGDSNTHGKSADQVDYLRVPSDRRWTGLVQSRLGAGFDVLEEGLVNRTTDLDFVDSPGFNGRDYFLPCLLSHDPLDVVVIMLGTNDLQSCFDRTPQEIANALGGYIDDVNASGVATRDGRVPSLLLVSPIWINDDAPLFHELASDAVDARGVQRSRELSEPIRGLAHERAVLFEDAAEVAGSGKDGVHLSLDSHARLAEVIAPTVLRATSSPLR